MMALLNTDILFVDKSVPQSVFEYDFDGVPVLYRDMIHNHIDEIFQNRLFYRRGKI